MGGGKDRRSAVKYNRKSRSALKNYFPLPNEIFSLGLYSGEISVYAYLMYLEDRKNFQCHPSYKTIGRALKMSRNTVRKYVKGLEEKRLISTEPSSVTLKSGKKQNGNLIYAVLPIQEAVEYFYTRQLQNIELSRKINDTKQYSTVCTKKAV